VHCAEVLDELDTLPEEQRAVLLLVGVEGLAYDEAAEVLGVPIGTVMSRLSRARERLRRLGERRPAGVVPLRRVV
jgi:RNA polymerase sigma-70 factor (ECF subfamily)